MEPNRPITEPELAVLKALIRMSGKQFANVSLETTLVQSLDGGNTGTFMIFPDPASVNKRRNFGSQASEYEFMDADGVPVLVSLNLDEEGQLYEVDIWKESFDPVVQYAVPEEFRE